MQHFRKSKVLNYLLIQSYNQFIYQLFMENNISFFPAFPIYSTPLIPTINVALETFQQMSMQISQQNQEISNLKSQNQSLKAMLKKFQNEINVLNPREQELEIVNQCQNLRKKSKPERTFYCDYQNCDRVYASTLALNLHIKTKHNGGTKKERDAYAKLIVMAQINGQPIPQINFNFPKHYIQNFKQKMLAQKNILGNQRLQIQIKSDSLSQLQ